MTRPPVKRPACAIPMEHTVYRRKSDGRLFIIVSLDLNHLATGESDGCFIEPRFLRRDRLSFAGGRRITLRGLARLYEPASPDDKEPDAHKPA